jgi:hypothetical protein
LPPLRRSRWSENYPQFGVDFTAAGRYFVSLLKQLGYPAHIKTFPVNSASFGPRIADSRTAPQAWFGVGIPNYPAASQFLAGAYPYSCRSFIPDSTNLEELCDPQFDATVPAIRRRGRRIVHIRAALGKGR